MSLLLAQPSCGGCDRNHITSVIHNAYFFGNKHLKCMNISFLIYEKECTIILDFKFLLSENLCV